MNSEPVQPQLPQKPKPNRHRDDKEISAAQIEACFQRVTGRRLSPEAMAQIEQIASKIRSIAAAMS